LAHVQAISAALLLSHRLPVVAEAKLRGCQECLRIESGRLVGLGLYVFGESLQALWQMPSVFPASRLSAGLSAREAVHGGKFGFQRFQTGLPKR
jgi:hypothetical protein